MPVRTDALMDHFLSWNLLYLCKSNQEFCLKVLRVVSCLPLFTFHSPEKPNRAFPQFLASARGLVRDWHKKVGAQFLIKLILFFLIYMRRLKTALNYHSPFGKRIVAEHMPVNGTVLNMILFANHRETGALILKKPSGGWGRVAVWAQAFSKRIRIVSLIVGREREWRQWGRRLSGLGLG